MKKEKLFVVAVLAAFMAAACSSKFEVSRPENSAANPNASAASLTRAQKIEDHKQLFSKLKTKHMNLEDFYFSKVSIDEYVAQGNVTELYNALQLLKQYSILGKELLPENPGLAPYLDSADRLANLCETALNKQAQSQSPMMD